MKLNYDEETDSLYIDLADETSVDSEEIGPGIVIDLSADGRIVGIDIEDASKHLNLSSIQINAPFPVLH